MASEKIYVPKASARARTNTYGEFINLSFDVDALRAFAEQHRNSKGRVNFTVSKRREEGKFGETHSITLDTFEPKKRDEEPPF